MLSCETEKQLPSTEVFEIREIGELSSTEFVFSKVLDIKSPDDWYSIGNRRVLLSCKARVKAGIDLTKIQEHEIQFNGTEINIVLPPARITSFDMDPGSIKAEVVDVGRLRHNFTSTEINEFLKKGEESIRNTLSETGIYKEAEKNAISFVKDFYSQLGYEEVNVEIRKQNEK